MSRISKWAVKKKIIAKHKSDKIRTKNLKIQLQVAEAEALWL